MNIDQFRYFLSYHVENKDSIEMIVNRVMKEIEEEKFESYKKGINDEIKCVETSGEHLDLQKKLISKCDCWCHKSYGEEVLNCPCKCFKGNK